MWLTQTYLGEPSRDFPMHAYFLFNPYTEWDSVALRSIRAGLRVLGRSTKEQLAILMPDEQIDQKQVGGELDLKFRPLVDRLSKGGMICGLLILNKSLSSAKPNCSDARWVYIPFDKFIVAGGIKPEFSSFLGIIGESAREVKEDPIGQLVFALEGERTASSRRRFLNIPTASMSATGPSIGISLRSILDIFAEGKSIITNVYGEYENE